MKINSYEIAGRMPLFASREMRDAVRSGRKTQTRRIIKMQPAMAFSPKPDERNLSTPYQPGKYYVMREPLERFVYGSWVVGYADDKECYREYRDWQWKRTVLSSLFMPTEYGRTVLQIDSVKVERIQDITERDARAEGVVPSKGPVPAGHEFREAFAYLWVSIHGIDAWYANDWVFVYTFRKVD